MSSGSSRWSWLFEIRRWKTYTDNGKKARVNQYEVKLIALQAVGSRFIGVQEQFGPDLSYLDPFRQLFGFSDGITDTRQISRLPHRVSTAVAAIDIRAAAFTLARLMVDMDVHLLCNTKAAIFRDLGDRVDIVEFLPRDPVVITEGVLHRFWISLHGAYNFLTGLSEVGLRQGQALRGTADAEIRLIVIRLIFQFVEITGSGAEITEGERQAMAIGKLRHDHDLADIQGRDGEDAHSAWIIAIIIQCLGQHIAGAQGAADFIDTPRGNMDTVKNIVG